MPTDSVRLHAVFDLAMRIGEGLLTNGAAASEVTATVLRVTSSSGLRNVSVQVTFDEVTISYLPDELGTPFTRVRSVGARVQDFARLAAYEDVSHQYLSGELPLEEARHRAASIPQAPPRYRLPLVVGGFAVMGGAAALSFGAGALVVLAATLSAALLIALSEALARRNIPPFYAQALGGFVAVGGAVIVALIDPSQNPSIVVVSCIIVQLAGLSSISAVQDAVTGWYVTAAGRILEALMLTVGLVAGVRGGLLLADVLGADISVTAAMPVTLTTVLAVIVAGLGMGLGYGVGTQVPGRLLLAGSLVAAGSGVIAHVLSGLLLDRSFAAGVAAFVTGLVATALGDRLRAPALAFVMCGVIPLVPGSRIYRGLLGLDDEITVGLSELMGAVEIAVAIAAGVVLGQLLSSRIMPYFRRSGIAYTPAISTPFTTLRRRRLSLGSRRQRRRRGTAIVEPSTMTEEMTALSPAMFEDTDLLEILEPPADLEDTSGRRPDPEETP
ncbi:threonine/serine exporter ThrE family protein [Brachybacterium sp. YJGR34]|uniref:threonine/serine ThrE exporter family protein n=1 Tax=Brachybacterium sp. YJGR34 TaxID=2059911 RepID=UPI000E0A44C8|nr:threonine/serine exporter family protein [Brachybacterium sp. YJGR34]